MYSIIFVFLMLFRPLYLFPYEIVILNKNIPLKEEIIKIAKKEGEPESIKSKVNKFLKYNGYIITRVRDIVKYKDTIYIIFDEGRLKDIKIKGNFKISKRLLNVYIRFRPGDIFNEKELKLQLKKLYSTGLFSKINYTLYPDRKILLIKIEEKKKRFFKIGGNISTKYGIMPSVKYIDRDLFGSGTYFTSEIEAGIYKQLMFQKYKVLEKINNYSIILSFRKGIVYFKENDYNEESLKFHLCRKKEIDKYTSFDLKLFIEGHNFYNTEKIKNENIVEGLRYGAGFVYLYSNKRDVIEKIKENIFKATVILKLYQKNFLSSFSLFYKKYLSPFLYTGILFRHYTGLLAGKLIPFDEKFPVGGEMQRGLYKGEYWTSMKLENSLEFEYEIYISKLFTSIFCDTSLIKQENTFIFILSAGLGLRFNLWGFSFSAYYGFPVSGRIYNGQFYFKTSRIF